LLEFHVLDSSQDALWLRYICALAQHHLGLNQRVVIVCDDAATLNRVDEYLWTFEEASFLPHEQLSPSQTTAPIGVIGLSHKPIATDILIHLGREALTEIQTAAVVVDVIDAEPSRRDAGRARFSAYRKLGLAAKTCKNPPLPALTTRESGANPS
jgi:DNA polymerase III subunit chi